MVGRSPVQAILSNKLRGLKRTIPNGRPPLIGEDGANFFADRECRVVSATDPDGRILGFIDRSRYYFFQVAPQLYS
jgi:hypothetical protein